MTGLTCISSSSDLQSRLGSRSRAIASSALTLLFSWIRKYGDSGMYSTPSMWITIHTPHAKLSWL